MFHRVQQCEQIIQKTDMFFSRFSNRGGTRVFSADFFFEHFGKKTLQHRVSIVIGLVFVLPKF